MGLMPGTAASMNSGADVIQLLDEAGRAVQGPDHGRVTEAKLEVLHDLIRAGKRAEVLEAATELTTGTLERKGLIVVDFAKTHGGRFRLAELEGPLRTIREKLLDPASDKNLSGIPQRLQEASYVPDVDRALQEIGCAP